MSFNILKFLFPFLALSNIFRYNIKGFINCSVSEKKKDYIKIDFNEPHEFSKYIQTIKKKSMYDYGIKVDENDQILTLSTCSGKKRIVLHAKRIV